MTRSSVILTLFAFAITALPVQADDWDFVVAPYFVAPSITGEASIGRIEGVPIDVNPADIIKALNIGAMIHFEAHHEGGFGVNLDYSFMDLGDKGSLPQGLGEVEAGIFQGALEAMGAYRWKRDENTVDVYAGIRWWDIRVTTDLFLPMRDLRVKREDNWVDPVVGMRWFTPVTSKLKFKLRGDIGGFGAGSKFSWRAHGGILWQFKPRLALALDYMALSVDRRRGQTGTPDRFVYDTVTHGPLVGVAFTF